MRIAGFDQIHAADALELLDNGGRRAFHRNQDGFKPLQPPHQFVRRPDGHDLPRVDHHHALAGFGDFRQNVRA